MICVTHRIAALPLAALVLVAGLARPCIGEDAVAERRKLLLAQMQAIAEKTNVQIVGQARAPELVKSPIFRYDDQPRRFIDATMWAWTEAGRPVAFQKVEASIDVVTNVPKWGYCFTSLAEGKLNVAWGDGREYRSTEPGVSFRPMPEAPSVAARSADRRRQARELSRKFSARILLDPRANTTEEMRLLSTPLFEYDDPQSKNFRGAVFGYSTSGRNPDLVVVFEIRDSADRETWHFAPARMTIGGVTLKHRDKTVWEVPFIEPVPKDFPTWTFFYQRREPVAGEEQP